MRFQYRDSKIDKFFCKIPNSIINLLSIASALGSIITPVVGYFKIKRNIAAGKVEDVFNWLLMFLLITFILVCIVFANRIIKYKQLLQGTRKVASECFYNFLHDFRNSYFDILNQYKNDQLTPELLSADIESFLNHSLDYLCKIFSEFTRQEVCACIKYIDGMTESINLNEATYRTLVRSSNTDINRKNNDKTSDVPAKIKDSTALYSILDPNSLSKKSYFYQRSLIKYKNILTENHMSYNNTTQNWADYYKSIIVVPIRIANERLFFNNQNNKYNVVGFLCVDSLSENAFLENQEKYNVLLIKSFAAGIYTILNQYKYYLGVLTREERE